MSHVIRTSYHGADRKQVPDLLQHHGIAVQMLRDHPGQLEMRCTRDKVTVRLSILRGAKSGFDIEAEPEPTGLMVHRWPRALKLAEDVIHLVQTMDCTWGQQTSGQSPHSSQPRKTTTAPAWMFVLGILVMVIMTVPTFVVLRDGLQLSQDARLTIFAAVNLPTLIVLGFITVAIERRTAEPGKTLRSVARGAFCLGCMAVYLSSIYRTVNERGAEIYTVCGPQTMYDQQSLDYGFAMIVVAAVAFVVPNRFTMTFTGLGISLGGAMQLWIAKQAMAGEVQLRAVTGDGIGKLMEQFPVIPLLMGGSLLLAGIGAACHPWLRKSEAI